MTERWVNHTSSTTRRCLVNVPDDIEEIDVEHFLYENVQEDQGEIVGGGWIIENEED